jgi:NAD+ diphosphatase
VTRVIFQDGSIITPEGDGLEDNGRSGTVSETVVSKDTIAVSDTIAAMAADFFAVPGPGGAADGSGLFHCYMLKKDAPLPPGWKAQALRSYLSDAAARAEPDAEIARLFRAFHIMQWRSESVFCGSCGAKNRDAETEVARCCPVCGRLEYPRISPAMIALVENEAGEILLAHNKKFAGNVYSLLAGFVEAGETLEETVAREIREEAGIEVGGIRYLASQSWPFPNSLMIAFAACYTGGSLRVDGIEIEDARWFRRDNLPPLPGKGSIARRLIDTWSAGRPRPVLPVSLYETTLRFVKEWL